MKLSVRRSRWLGATFAGAAAAGAIALSGTGIAAATPAASHSVVIVNCANKAQVEPTQVILACADGNALVSGLHWVSWKSVAFGTGTEMVNDCTPSCAAGHFYSYPVLVTAWRAVPRPGHNGQLYFSRLTAIHTGKLSRAHGFRLPLTQTFELFASI